MTSFESYFIHPDQNYRIVISSPSYFHSLNHEAQQSYVYYVTCIACTIFHHVWNRCQIRFQIQNLSRGKSWSSFWHSKPSLKVTTLWKWNHHSKINKFFEPFLGDPEYECITPTRTNTNFFNNSVSNFKCITCMDNKGNVFWQKYLTPDINLSF